MENSKPVKCKSLVQSQNQMNVIKLYNSTGKRQLIKIFKGWYFSSSSAKPLYVYIIVDEEEFRVTTSSPTPNEKKLNSREI